MEFINFEVLDSLDAGLLQVIKKLEIENLGVDAALNEWQIPVFTRYGRFIIALGPTGEIAGVCQALRSWKNPDVAFIHSFYIVQKFRNRGAGKSLLGYVIELFRTEGFKRAELTVDPENAVALKLYAGFGFKVKELKNDEYGHGFDRYLMELSLIE